MKSFSDSNIRVRNNNPFAKTTFNSEGAVFHNILHYKQLSIARYQVSFYTNNALNISYQTRPGPLRPMIIKTRKVETHKHYL